MPAEENILQEPADDLAADRVGHLKNLFDQLDERCKLVLNEFYYEKRDLRSIANVLGVDEGSARTMKYRCMMKLRKFHAQQRTDFSSE